MRELYIALMPHAPVERGVTGEPGPKFLKEWEEMVAWIWDQIGDPAGLVVYRDSLGMLLSREQTKEVHKLELAEIPTSPLYRLVDGLLARGAILEGTEDMDLVLRQFEIEALIYGGMPGGKAYRLGEHLEEAEDVTQKRDVVIAHRICETLGEGERALLLIGALHDVAAELRKLEDAADIKIIEM